MYLKIRQKQEHLILRGLQNESSPMYFIVESQNLAFTGSLVIFKIAPKNSHSHKFYGNSMNERNDVKLNFRSRFQSLWFLSSCSKAANMKIG